MQRGEQFNYSYTERLEVELNLARSMGNKLATEVLSQLNISSMKVRRPQVST